MVWLDKTCSTLIDLTASDLNAVMDFCLWFCICYLVRFLSMNAKEWQELRKQNGKIASNFFKYFTILRNYLTQESKVKILLDALSLLD